MHHMPFLRPHTCKQNNQTQIKVDTYLHIFKLKAMHNIIILHVPSHVSLINLVKWVCSCQVWSHKHATPEKVLGVLLVMLMKPPPSSVFRFLLSCWHSLYFSTEHHSIVGSCPCSAGIRQDDTQQNEDPKTLVKVNKRKPGQDEDPKYFFELENRPLCCL